MSGAGDRGGRTPLVGIRAVEIGQMIAGPFAGHLLADYGADVIKVETRDGDVMRRWGGQYKGLGLYWPIIARNKRSVTLDLRVQRGQQLLKDLARSADVLVENFRPGTLERWGLGPEQLLELNPRLVMVRVSGYGQTGPYRDRAGFGVIGEAMGGLRYLTGEPTRPPVRAGVSLGDALAGTFGAMGALLGLYARDGQRGTGRGQVVDVAIYEAVWAYMEGLVAQYEKLGIVQERTGATLPGIAPSNIYPTSDGQWILVAGNADNVFARLAELMGQPELATDPRFSSHQERGKRMEELDDLVARWTLGRPSDALLEALERAGVPAGRIYSAADIAADPQYRARDMIVRIPQPSLGEDVPGPGIVPKLGETPGRVTRGGPLLGEHNREVFCAELGLAEDAFRQLVADGVI